MTLFFNLIGGALAEPPEVMWLTSLRQTRSDKTVKNSLLVSDGALRSGDVVEES